MTAVLRLIVATMLIGSHPAFSQALRSAAEPDYPPFSIVNPDGAAAGFAVDLLKASVDAMGLDVEFKTAPWDQIKNELADGELDVLPLVGRTPEREELFDFTIPYLTLHGALFVRTDETEIQSLSDLPGKRIVVMKGDNAEEYVRRTALSDQIITTPTFEDAFRMLASGEADAVIAQKLMGVSLLKELGLDSVHVVGKPNEEFKQDFSFAVYKGNSKLLATLNEGLALAIADRTYTDLRRKWMGTTAYEATQSRVLVYAGDRAFPPYEFLDEKGRPAGFNIDMARALSREIGLDISFTLLPWSEVRRMAAEGELDMTSMLYSEQRDRQVNFSVPISLCYMAVFARNDSPQYIDLEHLKAYRISVQDGDLAHDYLLENGFENQLTVTQTPDEALKLLAEGTVDFSLSALAQGQYWIKNNGWKNLRVAEPRLLISEYCFAVPEGRQELVDIINHGLLDLKSSGEYRRIYNQWLAPFDSSGNWQKIRRSLLIALIGLALAGLLTAVWIFLLNRRVRARTSQLHKSEGRFTIATEAGGIGIWDRDIVNDRLIWDGRMFELYGIDRTQFAGAYEAWVSCIHPDDRAVAEKTVEQAVAGEKEFDTEFRITRPDNGETRYIRAFGKVIRDKNGKPIRMIGTNQDVTERVESEERYQLLFNSSPIGIAIYQPVEKNDDFVFLDMNPAGLRIGGKASAEDLVGKKVSDVFPGVRESGLLDVFSRVTKSGESDFIPITQYSDSHLNLCVENYVFKLPSGLLVVLFEDVSKEHQAKESLRESEERFRSTVNGLQVGVVVHYADTSILLSNPAARDILGLSEEQLLGKKAAAPAWCFVKEDLSVMDVSEYPVNQVISSKEPLSALTLGIRRPNQDDITWVLCSAVPLFNNDNELEKVIVNFMDITARKAAETELLARSEELQKFNKAMVGRELRMAELKKEINALCRKLDEPEIYP
jgi:PAS domain S-box-containing protein